MLLFTMQLSKKGANKNQRSHYSSRFILKGKKMWIEKERKKKKWKHQFNYKIPIAIEIHQQKGTIISRQSFDVS